MHGIDRTRFWEKVDRSAGDGKCWHWQAATFEDGYGAFWERGRIKRAHRVALEMSLGRPLDRKEFALHSCDERACVNPAHLSVGDPQRNAADARRRGRLANGSDQLAFDRQRMIERRRAGASYKEVCKEFGVGRQWAYVIFKEAGLTASVPGRSQSAPRVNG